MEGYGIPSKAEKPEHEYADITMMGRMMGVPLHFFCRGCGYGAIAQAICRVYKDENLDPCMYPLIVGVGCYSQIPLVLPGYSYMTLHGRGPAVATGMKLANPKLKPISIQGDGDAVSIGTNHLIHAARRNIDMIVIMLNNGIYGMTGGQVAPTTPTGMFATTSPYGYEEQPIDAVELVKAAGATYIARWNTAHMRDFIKSIKTALNHKGFSFIEIHSQCVTYFGRKNKMGDPVQIFRWIRDHAVKIEKAKDMSPEELKDKYIIGEFLKTERPTLSEVKYKLIKDLRSK
ncbi:MAG: thiamine pyrophosphate-dependent enzyme [Candidatus Helarchaeota archaeon]